MIYVLPKERGAMMSLESYLYDTFMQPADPNLGVIEKMQENYEFLASAVSRMMAMQFEKEPNLTKEKIEEVLFGEPCGQLEHVRGKE